LKGLLAFSIYKYMATVYSSNALLHTTIFERARHSLTNNDGSRYDQLVIDIMLEYLLFS
jgi:hypothetical protein